MDLEDMKRARVNAIQTRNRLLEKTFGSDRKGLEKMLEEDERERNRALGPPDPDKIEPKGLRDWWVWDDYTPGSFENIGTIRLTWVDGEAAVEGLMLYTPDPQAPFSFVDHSGLRITPGAFLTDSGSIPGWATSLTGIEKTGYLPAYLIHDWEYALHHCKRLGSDRTRAAVDETLFEGVKTLMVSGAVPEHRRNLWRIKTAVQNAGWAYWNAEADCGVA